MAKITIYGYVVACDPGINNFSAYKGTIDTADIKSDMDLKQIVTDSWWRSEIAHRFTKLTFIELCPEGVLMQYGENQVLVKYGGTKYFDKVGLSYAYAQLVASVEDISDN